MAGPLFSARQAWSDTGLVAAVAVSRLSLVLLVAAAEDGFTWLYSKVHVWFSAANSLPVQDLRLLLRYSIDALNISLLVAVIVFAVYDIVAVLVLVSRRIVAR
jgi:hypothetical protein